MWRNYLVTAVRHLANNRLYAAISIASLAIGFAVAILVGVFVRHELSYDRFLPDYGRLYFVRQTLHPPAHGAPWFANATRNDVAAYLKADFPQIEAATRLQMNEVAIQRGDVISVEPDFAYADPNLLQVLKLPLAAGDSRTALKRPDSLILTPTLARKYFGDTDPIGQTLLLHTLAGAAFGGAMGAAVPYRVTAVLRDLPPETHLKVQALAAEPPEDRGDPPAAFGQEALTYVLLAPRTSPNPINRQLRASVRRHIPPGPLLGNTLDLRLAPISELHLPRVRLDNPGDINPTGDRTVLAVVAAIGSLILLTAATNFVGLMTARAAQRAVEIGVRKSVGARRGDLIAQFLSESLVQVFLAFILAVAAAELLAPAVGRLLDRPLTLDYVANATFIAGLAGGALLIGLAAGAYPALVLSAFRPASALKGGEGPTGSSNAVREALVVAQFAVLVLLMIVIVTVWRQTRLAIAHASPLRGEQVLLVNGRPICGAALEDQIRRLPGVRDAVCSANVVFLNTGAESSARTLDGRSLPIEFGPVEAGFFEFYGLKPLAGRVFDPARPADQPLTRDPTGAVTPVVINATAARRIGFATPSAAVGQFIHWDRMSMPFVDGQFRPKLWRNQSSEVIGVTPDYAGTSRLAVKPMIYWVDPAVMATLSVKVDGMLAPRVLHDIDRLWRAAGHVRAADAELFEDHVRRAYRDVLTLGEVVSACAILALALAVVGLFALASYTSERRTKEFGVRKAMGAGAFDIARLLLWQFSKPVLAASLIALPAGYLVMRWWLNGFADRVSLAPWTFIAVTAAAVAIAWLTVLAHTWRVAKTRPVAALRYE